MTFIHELDDGSRFTWDSPVLVEVLADVRHKQGRFLGRMEALGFDHRSEAMLGSVLRKARLWERIHAQPVNERQRKVISRMLEHDWEGNLSTSKYARMTKCSHDTALRDIKQLLQRGVLRQNERGGRSTSYRLAEPDEI